MTCIMGPILIENSIQIGQAGIAFSLKWGACKKDTRVVEMRGDGSIQSYGRHGGRLALSSNLNAKRAHQAEYCRSRDCQLTKDLGEKRERKMIDFSLEATAGYFSAGLATNL